MMGILLKEQKLLTVNTSLVINLTWLLLCKSNLLASKHVLLKA